MVIIKYQLPTPTPHIEFGYVRPRNTYCVKVLLQLRYMDGRVKSIEFRFCRDRIVNSEI